MGLDFTFKKIKKETQIAHWSYSGFMRFRERLAKKLGFNLREMKGFDLGDKSWAEVKSPLKYFLNHSDCEGQISPQRCRLIAKEIEKIITDWPKDDFDKQEAQLLIENMKECFVKDVPLIFC